MYREDRLRYQLLKDLERLHILILQYAAGEHSVKQERDRLEGAIQVKFAFWRALARWPVNR